ncbi:MAG: hypothetical protein AB1627_11500 [Chloroflexota bacterium]
MKHRTPAYWPTRVMLAVGILATAAVVVLAAAVAGIGPLAQGPCFGCDDPEVFGLTLRASVVQAAVAVGLALFGLVWMLRIFRGPRDEPPAWRHRR